MTRWHSLPTEVYTLVERSPAAMLLEGRKPNPPESTLKSWTQLFCKPELVCSAWKPEEISDLFIQIEHAVSAGKYAAGFFSYECGSCFEPKAATRPPREGVPLAWFGIYSRSKAFDHETGAFIDGEPAELVQFRT